MADVQSDKNFTVTFIKEFSTATSLVTGACGGVVVKALRYKLAGHRFYYRWCHWNFSLT